MTQGISTEVIVLSVIGIPVFIFGICYSLMWWVWYFKRGQYQASLTYEDEEEAPLLPQPQVGTMGRKSTQVARPLNEYIPPEQR